MRRLLPIIMLIVLLGSCKPKVPSEYIQPRKMENILYDYHIALGIAQEQYQIDDERHLYDEAYKLAVLRKHGVTEAEFEASMEYYMRHTKRLHKIYEHITERLENEAVAQGVSEGELSQYDSNTAQGDTANLWRWEKDIVLTKQSPYNHYSFILKADTSYHKGDRMTMTFNTQYLVQDGSRDAVIVLAMRLANDSVITQYQHMMTNSRQTVSISDNGKKGIKEIRGYFMLAPDTESNTTMKLLFISNIKLLRTHLNANENVSENVNDNSRVNENDNDNQNSNYNKTINDSDRNNNRPDTSRLRHFGPPTHKNFPPKRK